MGSGLVFSKVSEENTRYYLRNVVSGNSLESSVCGENRNIYYTRLDAVKQFIFRKLLQYPNIVNITASSALSK